MLVPLLVPEVGVSTGSLRLSTWLVSLGEEVVTGDRMVEMLPSFVEYSRTDPRDHESLSSLSQSLACGPATQDEFHEVHRRGGVARQAVQEVIRGFRADSLPTFRPWSRWFWSLSPRGS